MTPKKGKVPLSYAQYALLMELKKHGKIHFAALNANTVKSLIRMGIVRNKKGNVCLNQKFNFDNL